MESLFFPNRTCASALDPAPGFLRAAAPAFKIHARQVQKGDRQTLSLRQQAERSSLNPCLLCPPPITSFSPKAHFWLLPLLYLQVRTWSNSWFSKKKKVHKRICPTLRLWFCWTKPNQSYPGFVLAPNFCKKHTDHHMPRKTWPWIHTPKAQKLSSGSGTNWPCS